MTDLLQPNNIILSVVRRLISSSDEKHKYTKKKWLKHKHTQLDPITQLYSRIFKKTNFWMCLASSFIVRKINFVLN